MKKYDLYKDDSIVVNGHTLYKVLYTHEFIEKYKEKYLSDDDKEIILTGGYIESENNLPQDDYSVVLEQAKVFGNAVISNSQIYNNAMIYDNARVSNSLIFGNAEVYKNATIQNCIIYWNSNIHGEADITDSVIFAGSQDSEITGYISISRNNRFVMRSKI